MQVKFYKNISDKRVVNKNISLMTTLNCILKDDCSILNPYLTTSTSQLATLSLCNYVYIPDFNRYYYARISKSLGGVLVVECDVDVLMSWNGDIASCQGFIIRQEFKYNRYFNDTRVPIREEKTYSYLEIGALPNITNYFLTVDGGADNASSIE